jgi:hypothetical protein
MNAFIIWVYTGLVDTEMQNLYRLWALGHRLVSPKFSNDVIHALFSYFNTEPMTRGIAEEIYELAPPGSKLRKFCADVITADGPLSSTYRYYAHVENWKILIKGGDLVLDQAEQGLFRDVSRSKPYHPSSQAKYIDVFESN